MTDNHDYNTPPSGSADWDVPLNNNFTDLDTDVAIRDTDANKSNYTPKDGAKFEATDTGAIYVGDGSTWVLQDRKVDSLNAVSKLTDPAGVSHTGELADAADVSNTQSAVSEPNVGAGDTMFEATFHGEPFTTDFYDPMVFHRQHFDDNDYRVLLHNYTSGEHTLYRTSDFDTFTQISADITPNISVANGQSFQDHIVLDDGTFALYRTVDEGGTNPRTDVWTGDSLTNLSLLGTAVSGWVDCGVVLDRATDTVHIYPEGAAVSGEPTSDIIKHFTTPANDLLNSTEQADAIDVSGKVWHTGDVDIVELGGDYYMFLDRSEGHPVYHIALAKSTDLYNWEIVTDKFTDVQGGDMVATKYNGVLKALTEFSGSDEANIGNWTLEPHTSDSLILASERGGTPGDHLIGTSQVAVYARNGEVFAKPHGGQEVSLQGGGGSTVTVIEDFEDGNISEYALDTGVFSTQTSTVFNGSTALQATTSTSGGKRMVSTNFGVSSGNTYRANVRFPTTDVSAETMFGVQDETSEDGYVATVIPFASKLRLDRRDGGTLTTLAETTSVTYSTNIWYEFEFDWGTGGVITLTLFDDTGSQVAQVSHDTSGDPTTYSSGGVGWRFYNGVSSSRSAYYDYLRQV